jgi:hypothetical protein
MFWVFIQKFDKTEQLHFGKFYEGFSWFCMTCDFTT